MKWADMTPPFNARHLTTEQFGITIQLLCKLQGLDPELPEIVKLIEAADDVLANGDPEFELAGLLIDKYVSRQAGTLMIKRRDTRYTSVRLGSWQLAKHFVPRLHDRTVRIVVDDGGTTLYDADNHPLVVIQAATTTPTPEESEHTHDQDKAFWYLWQVACFPEDLVIDSLKEASGTVEVSRRVFSAWSLHDLIVDSPTTSRG